MLDVIWNFIARVFSALWTLAGEIVAGLVEAIVAVVFMSIVWMIENLGVAGTILAAWVLFVLIGILFAGIVYLAVHSARRHQSATEEWYGRASKNDTDDHRLGFND